MKKLFVISIFSLILITGVTHESRAETWDCGEIENTVSCTLDDNGIFTVSGNGKMKNYRAVHAEGQWIPDAPWSKNSYKEIRKITKIIIKDGVTHIGNSAFVNAGATSISVADSVSSIGSGSFSQVTGVENFYAKNVKTVGGDAFAYWYSLKNMSLPKATNIGSWNFTHSTKLEFLEVAENVTFQINSIDRTSLKDCTGGICAKCGNRYALSGTGCVADCGKGFLGKEGMCISAAKGCGKNYKDMGGFCNRIRYTYSEAAAILNNDNNIITITFKLNR